jgi:hypothetical protein
MGISSESKLCETLTTLAEWTNEFIAKGFSTGLGILEETITNYILIEIASRHPQNIYTKTFSRKQEGCESGADWLWCIGNPGEWLPILVQAKIVNPRTKQCHYLDYGTSHGKQGQLLVRYARTHRLLPLYCIYSLIDEDTNQGSMQANIFSHLRPTDWACSFIIPKHVQQLIRQNKKSQSDLLKYSIPWMTPFCADNTHKTDNLAQVIATSLLNSYNEFKKQDEASVITKQLDDSENAIVSTKKHKENLRVQWATVDPTILLIPKLPKIAVRLLTSRVRAMDSPISAISIISNTTIDEVMETEKALPPSNKDLPLFRGRRKRGENFWRW